MRILVSGASGFIGSGLVAELSSQGHDVCALMRKTASAEFLKGIPFTRLSGDLRDQDSLNRACESIDVVIHLAGLTAAKDREEFFRFNAEGTKNLAQAALKSGTVKKFIYLSTQAAGGPSVGLAPKNESDPDHPVSMYGESKLRGELYLEELKGQLPFIILRAPMVYGPRDKNIFLFFKTIQKNWMPLLPAKTTTGHKYYSSIHVEDLIQAILLSTQAPSESFTQGERFYLSDGKIYTYERIMTLIAEDLKVNPIRIKIPETLVSGLATGGTLLGKALNRNLPFNRDKLNEFKPDYWICSPQKFMDATGFKAKYTMETGIPQTAAWYKVQGWL